LRVTDDGERIPLTVSGTDGEAVTVRIIFRAVGATTDALARLGVGDSLADFVGPLGRPTECEGISSALVVGGGVGCAIALPVAERLHELGASVTSVIGFRSEDFVILEDEFAACSEEVCLVTDDGSAGEKGNACLPIERMLRGGRRFDCAFIIGPLVMMKYVVQTLRPYNIPCKVSMNPIMIDGTGMCGGCRLTLVEDGKRVTRFACVDGPEFDGYAVDFDEALSRLDMYRGFEQKRRDESCNLFKEAGRVE
jgi:ferredoxin--NADP+ reductase